jgi:hypothetical protein
MLTLVKKVDSANGYVFGGKHEQGNLSEMLSCAAGADFEYFKYLFVLFWFTCLVVLHLLLIIIYL